MKAYGKNLRRMFRANILRLTAIGLIIVISIALVTAISSLPPQMRDALKNARQLSQEQAFLVHGLADKIELLSSVFPTFFILVSALTALITITRLVEEERPTIACYRSLGYSKTAVVFRYMIFAFTCSIVGCAAGIFCGNYLLRPVMFDVIVNKFDVPYASGFYLTQGLVWSAAMTAAVVLTAMGISLRRCAEKPAALLRHKAPKAGKKFFLERAPFIWKRLKFKYKSTARNIWRYKGRLLMTVLSVAGATMILFAGFGLFSTINSQKNDGVQDMAAFVSSMNVIAVAIILCAVGLCVLVLFNLTNVNIEERRREIATLKVLGYNQIEVAGFIFREIMVLSVFGMWAGLPGGYYLVGFILDYVELGSPDMIGWGVWFLTAAVALASVILADVLLYRKINKIDMHTSLKTVE
ncbi:MAG: ABC transporter permease [Firmicutes bacterium]|nr:ABC transporter permease [Bacillota bacterium]